jgi:hypothetical protein
MDNHFLGVVVFYLYFESKFSICLMILCASIPTIFLICFSTWRVHNHFVWILYTTRGSFGWNIHYFNTSQHSSFYYNNPPYLCFSFICQLYAYYWFYFKCDTDFFMIINKVCSIMIFHSTNKVHSLVSIGVKFIHVTFFRFSYTRHMFLYSMCINGFYAICDILCCKSVLRRSQHCNYPMFVNPQITFMMLLFYYTQHLGYLLHATFSILSIL